MSTEVMAAPGLKGEQIEALRKILPPTSEVAQMLNVWIAADRRYWQGNLTPCWLSCGIEPYGKAIGSWCGGTRTLNLVPMLFHTADPTSWVRGVMIHEACHQAQSQLYRHLDQATGPRGRWTDQSHRCPSWSRAVEDVIQVEGLPVFCPVWHRGTKNRWHPWVPAQEDWTVWRRVEAGDRFDGRRLLSFDEARGFMPYVSLSDLMAELQTVATPEDGMPGPGWGL